MTEQPDRSLTDDARPQRVRTKLCGLTREADVDAVVAAGADAVGVVSAVEVDTPREVDRARAQELLARVPPFVTGVLVTMPDGGDEAVDLVARTGADVLQVHGTSVATVDEIATAVDVSVLAGVDVQSDVAAYADHADAVLLDSTDEHGGGGTGETHDWERAATIVETLEVPVVLAGGLTPENVADAVDRVRPFAVDVASGVEHRGGIKDHEAVRAFVAHATGRREVEA